MTKSYRVYCLSALLALGLVSLNAAANERVVAPLPESTANVIQSDEQASSDLTDIAEQGLPLFPLLESESLQVSEAIDEAPADAEEEARTETPAVAGNLVELVEAESGPREFMIFVVRHMEKEESTLDPGLTADGVRRADGLAQLLSSTDIERIYSTLYRRSAGTALPLARALALPVEFYQPDAGDELVATLLDAGQSALVVGHSDTVADLVNALGGSAEVLSEDQYGDIFQLLLRVDGDDYDVRQVRLTAPLIVKERRGSR